MISNLIVKRGEPKIQVQPSNSCWSHLYFMGWPFQTVPDETFFYIWADRANLRAQIDRLIWRWHRVERSTFHLMWADLGAGKSHTLQYTRQYLLDHPELKILPIYVVMPKQMRNFLDVYRAIIAKVDIDFLAETFARACGSAAGRRLAVSEIFPDIPDVGTALLKILQAESDSVQLLAGEWLRATSGLTRRQLDTIGVNRRISTTDDAVATLGGIIRLIKLTGEYHRALFMLDECQRIGRFKLSIGEDINTGIQTWYDLNSKHLTLIMSFGSGEERFVRHLLSPELQSREDHLRISMPMLTKDEALDFIKDLFEYFRSPGAPSLWFPFTQELVESVIHRVVGDSGATPRALMKSFDALLMDADFQIGNGYEFQPSTNEVIQMVQKALQEPPIEADD